LRFVSGFSITHVLLIDDRDASLEWTADLLQSGTIPIDLERASSPAEAIELAAHRRIDVLLVEAKLLVQVGLHFRNLPIVVLGDEDEREAARAIAGGAQDYLPRRELTPALMARAIRYAIERHTMLRQLERLSLTDELTSLYNRRGFFVLGEQQLESARRTKLPLALLYVDVDGLKKINDTHGHAEGDRLLVDTAAILSSTFRAADIVARIGGDEFAVLAQLAPTDAHRPEVRLLEKTDARNSQHPELPPICLSLGIETLDPEKARRPLGDLLSAADTRMYASRRERDSRGACDVRALDSRPSTLDSSR
jgi:diguanylate cyclase (GGDEF)-like protein